MRIMAGRPRGIAEKSKKVLRRLEGSRKIFCLGLQGRTEPSAQKRSELEKSSDEQS
jgi:hypothetical protein